MKAKSMKARVLNVQGASARMAAMGHEERFPSTRLSAGCRFRKETIARMGGDGRDAP
jgi:hypothetical protein